MPVIAYNYNERRTLFMFTVPYQKMICDSAKGDGGINFYDEYCEWVNRYTNASIKIYYRDIEDVRIISGIKKTVVVSLYNGEKINFYLYKAATLRELLYEAVKRVTGGTQEYDATEDDDVTKLERLAKLHDSGALSDEEFAEAKQKILNK